MEHFIPIIIVLVLIFWSAISKIIGAVLKVLQTGVQLPTLKVEPDNRVQQQNDWTITELSSVRNESHRPEQEEIVIEIDENDIIESEVQPVPEKSAGAAVSYPEAKRQRLREAIVWSEILAPPVALRENKTEL